MYNADLAYLKIEIKNMYHKCFNSYDNRTAINDQDIEAQRSLRSSSR